MSGSPFRYNGSQLSWLNSTASASERGGIAKHAAHVVGIGDAIQDDHSGGRRR
jgi:hypothetical protein